MKYVACIALAAGLSAAALVHHANAWKKPDAVAIFAEHSSRKAVLKPGWYFSCWLGVLPIKSTCTRYRLMATDAMIDARYPDAFERDLLKEVAHHGAAVDQSGAGETDPSESAPEASWRGGSVPEPVSTI